MHNKKRKNSSGARAQTILELRSCKGGPSYALSPYLINMQSCNQLSLSPEEVDLLDRSAKKIKSSNASVSAEVSQTAWQRSWKQTVVWGKRPERDSMETGNISYIAFEEEDEVSDDEDGPESSRRESVPRVPVK